MQSMGEKVPDAIGSSVPAEATRMSPGFRGLSAAEFLVGALVVLGHNVWRMVPNEVYVLAPLGLVSARLRNGSWGAFGFRKPQSWGRVLAIAAGAAAVRILLGDLVVDPLTARFWPPSKAPAEAASITGNLGYACVALLFVWVIAAFGEEISYRGFLVNRAADVGKRTPAADWFAVIAVSVLFGFGHFYKGPAGIVDSGMAGLVLGAAYLVSGRNLWAAVLAHGFIDTFAVVALYFGMSG